MTDNNKTDADSEAIGPRVQEELARRRMSRQALADRARISLSTLEKALAGRRPFTLATIIRLEEALGTGLRTVTKPTAPATPPALAAESMGAYARAAVRWLEGRYLTLRPSFGTPGAVIAYLTTIRWIDDAGHLGYAETQRIDAGFEQNGHVSMPHLSGHIYLVTNESGQYRMMMLGRPSVQGTLHGILSTLEVGTGSQLVPVACPVTLIRLEGDNAPVIGLVRAETPQHARYRSLLDETISNDYARFHH